MHLVRADYNIAVTHGNGPQIGNAMIRVEETRNLVPALPLGICVADLQGGIGYMIAQSLQNRFIREGIDRNVVTVVTQVIIDEKDPDSYVARKPIGPYFDKKKASLFEKKKQWDMYEDAGRGYRRLVRSPVPRAIVEKSTIRRLVEEGNIVIASGGGGIPVFVQKDGTYEGFDAVIDKDLAAAILARDIAADILFILTNVNKVAINFQQPDQYFLDTVTVSELMKFLHEGHFRPGSMKPKIQAAINFLRSGGTKVVITSIDGMKDALAEKEGTTIIPG
jgi:carbamate kinase